MPLDDTTGFLEAPAKAKPPKADVFSVTGLRDWLKDKPSAQGYSICSTDRCLLAQYFEKPTYITEPSPNTKNFCVPPDAPIWKMAGHYPHTFGAALARCEAWLAEHPEEQ